MQRLINEGFFLKIHWNRGLFLKLQKIFLSRNPIKTPETPDSILKLHWKAQQKAEANPKSLMARLWRWHTGWCPGWKAYQAHLAEQAKS